MWRGVACLMLVVYHATFYVPRLLLPRDLSTWSLSNWAVKGATMCWVGVPMFFVVSGYCIAASIAGLQLRPYSLTTFFSRRLRRIYPPLWGACAWAVAVTWLIGTLSPTLHEQCVQLPRLSEFSLGNWLGNLFASEAWQHHLTGSKTVYLMNNIWTLCFEEQFYAISGLLLALSARRFVLGAMIVAVLTLAFRHWSRYSGLDAEGCFLQGDWLLFAAGILVFYRINGASKVVRGIISIIFGVGMIYAAADRSYWAATEMEQHMDEYIFVACGFSLMLGWLRSHDAQCARSTLFGPLFWCGRRSYSIYLTHFPLATALSCALHYAGLDTPALWLSFTLPLCMVTSIAAGWFFYVLVERHFLNAPIGQREQECRLATTLAPC